MDQIATQLLAEIEAFLAETSMTATAFGRAAVNDGHFVHNLREEHVDPRASTVDRCRAFMRDHQRRAA